MSNYIAGEHYNYSLPSSNISHTLESLKEEFKLNILTNYDDTLKFEVFNTPSDLHNTLRRIILNEVPSVAVDRVYFYTNTTCIEDSDLQLRIALIPIDVNPDKLEFYQKDLPNTDDISTIEHNASLLFELKADFKKRETPNLERFKKFVDPKEKDAINKFAHFYKSRPDKSIYSDNLVLCPYSNQQADLSNVKPIEDILLVRMMPGEEILVRALAVKGYGHDHAKFIPVSMAYGRRAHTIKLLSTIKGESAKNLQKLFPEGVIKIVKGVAAVGNLQLLTRLNKNFNEFEDLKGKVELGFDESHFYWHIESVRPKNQPAHLILVQAYQSMINKCNFHRNNIDQLAEAVKSKKDGFEIDVKKFGSKINGKFCYLEIEMKSKNFPIYRFYGETATLGVSLSFILTYLYGEKVVCAYSDFELGIEVIVTAATNLGKESSVLLSEGLNALADYFGHMKDVFQENFSKFHNNDVDME